MPFLTPLTLEVIPGDTWQLAKPMVYQHPKHGKITVSKGFKTDLASIPRIAHRIVNASTARTRRPAVIHDYLYSGVDGLMLTRKQADLIFYDAMVECGLNKLLALGMYYSVRGFGGRFWRGGHRD